MLLYLLTIFVSAFLLFQVQPLIARYILPWFGGSPAVWTTSMLFSQTLLLGGYLYAHLIASRLSARTQAIVHAIVLAVALIQLPIIPEKSVVLSVDTSPVWQVLLVLLGAIGLPYFALSSTSPLIQAWFNRVYPGRSPYRLYALSNVGSLLALLTYPTLVEPALTRNSQAILWSVTFAIFAVLCAASAFYAWRKGVVETEPAQEEARAEAIPSKRTSYDWILWLLLPATASILLLAITNQLSQDVAVVPFLWVLPLSIYLLTFIVAFDAPRWYVRPLFMALLIPSIGAIIYAMMLRANLELSTQIFIYLAGLFICCMVCHGELSRLKPDPRHLTQYYLMISLGGAIGGVFVALIAPALFDDFLELHLGLVLVFGLAMVVLFRARDFVLYRGKPFWAWASLGGVYAILIGVLIMHMQARVRAYNIDRSRNFYGLLAIDSVEEGTPEERRHMTHGAILHGMQFMAPDRQNTPTLYFSEVSGIGKTLTYFQQGEPRRIGLVGLGAGTLVTYGKEGDYFRLYEINPDVVTAAETYFTFLDNTEADYDTVVGDGRLALEQEEDQNYDILILDAFSGDSVPVHLLTQEAFTIYLRHLNEDGIIAANISNRYVNLQPVLLDMADAFDMSAVIIHSEGDPEKHIIPADWVLITRNNDFLTRPEIAEFARPLTSKAGLRLWTDDYTSLFSVLIFNWG